MANNTLFFIFLLASGALGMELEAPENEGQITNIHYQITWAEPCSKAILKVQAIVNDPELFLSPPKLSFSISTLERPNQGCIGGERHGELLAESKAWEFELILQESKVHLEFYISFSLKSGRWLHSEHIKDHLSSKSLETHTLKQALQTEWHRVRQFILALQDSRSDIYKADMPRDIVDVINRFLVTIERDRWITP